MDKKPLLSELANRSRALDFYAMGMILPNPDPVLKALGQDIKIYRQLYADAHVGGCIRRRKGSVKALEWGLDKGKAKSRIAAIIEGVFANLPITRILSEMHDAAFYGYQPLEVMWEVKNGLIIPVDIVGKPPEWFCFDPDNQLRMRTKQAPISGELLPERKFLLPRQDPSYDNPYGVADLSRCFWPATFKKGGLKFWVQFTEKYGSPWVVGKHPRSASTKETDELLDSLEAMVQDAVAAIPDDSSITIMEAAGKAGSADVYERLLTFCRAEISIALLGQNQTTESSSNRASATAGIEVTKDIRDADAEMIADAMNQLIRWICDINFGDVDRPTFSMWEQEEVDKVKAERDKLLKDAGANFTQSYFVRAYGLEQSDVAELPSAPNDQATNFAEADTMNDTDYLQQSSSQLAAQGQAVIDQWLMRIQSLVNSASSLPALQDALLSEFAELPEEELTKVMEVAYLAANLAGRVDVGAA